MLTSMVATAVAMPFLGVDWLPHDLAGWMAMAWLGVFNSAGAFALMFLLLRWRSTVHVSALLNLVPATTALVAVPVLGEALTVQAVLGLVGGAGRHVRRARPRAQAVRGHHLRLGPPV